MRAGLDSALQARRLVDLDDPTIDGLQTLLLLSQTFFAFGLGKKAYMTFGMISARCIAQLLTTPSQLRGCSGCPGLATRGTHQN